MTKIKALTFHQGFQDAYEGGKYVQGHRTHRSKKGRKIYKFDFNRSIVDAKLKKRERYLKKRGYSDEIVAY